MLINFVIFSSFKCGSVQTRILAPDGRLWHALLHFLLWDLCGWTYNLINHSKTKKPWPHRSMSQIEWDFSSLGCPNSCCQGSSSSFAMGV